MDMYAWSAGKYSVKSMVDEHSMDGIQRDAGVSAKHCFFLGNITRAAHCTCNYGFYGQFLWVNTCTVRALRGTLDGTACDGMYPS